jgi:hypothetical protein
MRLLRTKRKRSSRRSIRDKWIRTPVDGDLQADHKVFWRTYEHKHVVAKGVKYANALETNEQREVMYLLINTYRLAERSTHRTVMWVVHRARPRTTSSQPLAPIMALRFKMRRGSEMAERIAQLHSNPTVQILGSPQIDAYTGVTTNAKNAVLNVVAMAAAQDRVHFDAYSETRRVVIFYRQCARNKRSRSSQSVRLSGSTSRSRSNSRSRTYKRRNTTRV